MDNEATTRSGIFAGVPEGRCHVGAKSGHPCPREATEYRWPESTAPTVCAEHGHALKLLDEAEDSAAALEQLQRWIASLEAEGFGSGSLEWRVYFWRDELVEEAARAATRAKAAELTAMPRDPGAPGEGLPLPVRELMSTLLVRCEALTNARVALLRDAELKESDRLTVLDALAAATEEANQEAERYRAEHGFGE